MSGNNMTEKNLTISTGTDNFRKLITTSDVFIDKTLFIKEIIDSGDEAILITRPRRWGKSLALDMLKTFLAIEVDESGVKLDENPHKVLFTVGTFTIASPLGTSKNITLPKSLISDIEDGEYLVAQGQFPVLHVSFKDIKFTEYEQVENKFKSVIGSLYKQHKYLERSNILDEWEKARFTKHCHGIFEEAAEKRDELSGSLKFLTELLHKHHKKLVYVLVDEYDKPVNFFLEESLTDNIVERDKVAKFVEGMLAECGKGNNNLQKIILTGVFDTLKKEDNSGFNNVRVFAIDSARFSKSFGFSEEEVQSLIDKLDLRDSSANIIQNIRDWYNGYSVPISGTATSKVYTPWSVMSYLSDAYVDNILEPRSYWAESGASVILKNLMHLSPTDDAWNTLGVLAQGTEITVDHLRTSVLRQGTHLSIGMICYLLISSGYLTVRTEGRSHMVKVPNSEVKAEFESVITQELEAAKEGSAKKIKLEQLASHSTADKAVQVFNAIVEQNSTRVELLMQSSSIKCNDQSYSVSFLNLAALTGNIDIFNAVAQKCFSTKHVKSQNLTIFDYAHMAGNTSLIRHVQEHYYDQHSIVRPGYIDSLVCNRVLLAAISTGIVAIDRGKGLAAVVEMLEPMFAPLNLPTHGMVMRPIYMLASFAIITGTMLGMSTQFIPESYCQNYKAYNEIDANSPISYHSLSQFFKHRIENSKSYVSLGADCGAEGKKNTRLQIPAFADDSFPEMWLDVLLCKNNTGSIRQDDFKAAILNKLVKPAGEYYWTNLKSKSYTEIIGAEPSLVAFSEECISHSIKAGAISRAHCYEIDFG